MILETRRGTKIKLRTNSTDLMAFTNVWVLRDYDKSGFEIKNDDIVIDIGAHIGLFALYAVQLCKNGRVYCFEPVKENFELLQANLRLNGMTNVFPSNVAVSSTSDTVTIYLNDDESGHSMHVVGTKQIVVAATSLKDIIDANNILECNLVKIDCEGEEYGIINSLPSSYFEKIQKIIIEYHFADTKPHLLENLVKRLSEHYVVDRVSVFAHTGYLYAKKQPKI